MVCSPSTLHTTAFDVAPWPICVLFLVFLVVAFIFSVHNHEPLSPGTVIAFTVLYGLLVLAYVSARIAVWYGTQRANARMARRERAAPMEKPQLECRDLEAATAGVAGSIVAGTPAAPGPAAGPGSGTGTGMCSSWTGSTGPPSASGWSNITQLGVRHPSPRTLRAAEVWKQPLANQPLQQRLFEQLDPQPRSLLTDANAALHAPPQAYARLRGQEKYVPGLPPLREWRLSRSGPERERASRNPVDGYGVDESDIRLHSHWHKGKMPAVPTLAVTKTEYAGTSGNIDDERDSPSGNSHEAYRDIHQPMMARFDAAEAGSGVVIGESSGSSAADKNRSLQLDLTINGPEGSVLRGRGRLESPSPSPPSCLLGRGGREHCNSDTAVDRLQPPSPPPPSSHRHMPSSSSQTPTAGRRYTKQHESHGQPQIRGIVHPRPPGAVPVSSDPPIRPTAGQSQERWHRQAHQKEEKVEEHEGRAERHWRAEEHGCRDDRDESDDNASDEESVTRRLRHEDIVSPNRLFRGQAFQPCQLLNFPPDTVAESLRLGDGSSVHVSPMRATMVTMTEGQQRLKEKQNVQRSDENDKEEETKKERLVYSLYRSLETGGCGPSSGEGYARRGTSQRRKGMSVTMDLGRN